MNPKILVPMRKTLLLSLLLAPLFIVAQSGLPGSFSAEYANRTVTLETAGDIQYDTWGGRDHYRPVPPVNVTFEGSLWSVKRQRAVTHPPD